MQVGDRVVMVSNQFYGIPAGSKGVVDKPDDPQFDVAVTWDGDIGPLNHFYDEVTKPEVKVIKSSAAMAEISRRQQRQYARDHEVAMHGSLEERARLVKRNAAAVGASLPPELEDKKERFRAAIKEELGKWRTPNQVGGGHYEDQVLEPYDVCVLNNLDGPQMNVIKYITRFKSKEDFDKAIGTIERMKEYYFD